MGKSNLLLAGRFLGLLAIDGPDYNHVRTVHFMLKSGTSLT